MWLIVKAMNLASTCGREELLFDKMPVRCSVFFVVPFCVQNLMSPCTISIIFFCKRIYIGKLCLFRESHIFRLFKTPRIFF